MLRIVKDVDSFIFDRFVVTTSAIILYNDSEEYLLETFLHNDFKMRVSNALAQNIDMHKHRNKIDFLSGQDSSGKKFKVIKGIVILEELKEDINYDF